MKHTCRVECTQIEDEWIMARVPELPGAVTQGRDVNEAVANIKEATELLLQAYRDNASKDPAGKAIWESIGKSLGDPPDGTS
jgi:predicted RNase H-like HicB family nuclease